jgi:hypothetical protein
VCRGHQPIPYGRSRHPSEFLRRVFGYSAPGQVSEETQLFGNEVEDALRELEKLEKSLARIKPKTKAEETALEKARSQAAQLAEQLRSLTGGGPVSRERGE